VRDGHAERDALLLASRELGGEGVAASTQPDDVEQLVRAAAPSAGRHGAEREPQAHQLADRELRGQDAPVVLVEVADRARAKAVERPAGQARQLGAEDADETARGLVEAGEQAQQARLARSAGPVDVTP